jgi:serine/threonine protein kinase
MSEMPICHRCGAPLPPDSPEGLCPRCLIALNLTTQTEIPGETGAAKPPPGPPLPVADVAKLFPQLEILECLGRGGMGAVYKARQPRLDRIVALKILSPEKQGNQKFAERFEREARALAKLHHPNIVTVYDFGEVQGNFYLLMEFVDGLTLRQLLQARKLAPAEALAIVPKICEALQYAHEQGIVHRDIKPENILMDKEGRVKIADFGIAKILGANGRSTLTEEQAIGTPHYMSPEQIEKPQTVDHRADIYSLGVVFYEMLTGELPLGKFQPPSCKVQIDVRLDEIVLRALEKEPERRYQQASEVKTQVETVAATSGSSRSRREEAQIKKQNEPVSLPSTQKPDHFWRIIVILFLVIPVLGVLTRLALQNFIKPGNVAQTVNSVPTNSVSGVSPGENSILAQQPPVVVETYPMSGARDVQPGEIEIRVRFSKDMMDKSWSWSTAWQGSTPEFTGSPHYESDSRTCTAKVKLAPGRTYAFWLNSDNFHNFKDKDGRPAVPYLLIFQTKKSSMANGSGVLMNTNHPQVISVSPADGATDVDARQDVRIRFDQPMNPNDLDLMWVSGGFVNCSQSRYDPVRYEFEIPVQLVPGSTNKMQVSWAGRGFRNTNSIAADEFDWQFTTKPFAPKPNAPTPKVVQVLPESSETMPVLTLLELTFDQPMTLDLGLPYLHETDFGFGLPNIITDLSFDSSGRTLTIPVILPPDNETKLKLEGFYSVDGVASDPVMIRCDIGTNNYSSEQLDRISAAARDSQLEQLLSSIKAAREKLTSGIETIEWTSLYQGKGAFTGINAHPAAFKWQGTNQFYEDISDIMDSKAFILGCDGETCWLYADDPYNGRRLDKSPMASVAEIYASIADPFGLTRRTVQSAIAKGKLIYEGLTQLDGYSCYRVGSWSVEQTGNENYPVSASRCEWWISTTSYLPLQLIQYSQSGKMTFRFHFEALNQPLPIAAFQPPVEQGADIKPDDWYQKKLGPGEKRFLTIKDGSNGDISGRIGREGPNGSIDAGLN